MLAVDGFLQLTISPLTFETRTLPSPTSTIFMVPAGNSEASMVAVLMSDMALKLIL